MSVRWECVQPTDAHGKLIMEWRNDPETQKMSFHQEPKIWDTFREEFLGNYFAFPQFPPLFGWMDGERVAYLSLRPCPHPKGGGRLCCLVSIHVPPEHRQKGYGKQLLSALCAWGKLQGADDLYAEVKRENIASHHIFTHAGFDPLKEEVPSVTRYFKSLSPNKKEKPVFIIAEAGSNWCVGDDSKNHETAKELIHVAAEAGADAIKFQLFRPEALYVENAGSPEYIDEEMQELFTRLQMPYEMVEELANFCKEQRISFMASTFSPVDFDQIDPFVTCHKIASYEIGHIRLLEKAAHSGKPLILSTGAATIDEIAWALGYFQKQGGKNLTLLQCTASYPAPPESMHIHTLQWFKQRFGVDVGLSDHSRHPTAAPVAAVVLGAKVIEKHFTLSNDLPGPDHSFAIEPEELKEMIQAIRTAERMLGERVKQVDPAEEALRSFAKRGVQALEEIDVGDVLHEDKNIAILRPGQQLLGVHPRFIEQMEGKRSTRKLSKGEGVQEGDWEG